MTNLNPGMSSSGRGTRTRVAVALLMVVPMAVPASAQSLHSVFSAALQGDMSAALQILDSLNFSGLSSRDSLTADCIRSRFAAPPQDEELPPAARKILTAYRQYWQVVMLGRETAEGAEDGLLVALNEIFATRELSDTTFTSLDEASEAARAAIAQEGLFALTGVTLPYYELMLWRTQVPTKYTVELPGQVVDVNVVFMDQFVSLGWAGYATCGRSHSGGWATKDSLFAVASGYDTTTEQFRVSYLAHEGQHFADYGPYPELEQPELEYRAKLTEIAVSGQTTHHIILGFASRMGKDRGVPHHFADYCVMRDLSFRIFGSERPITDPEKWEGVPADRLRQEAAYLLKKNDEDLRRSDAATVEQFLTVQADG